jgi:hypothetical protein
VHATLYSYLSRITKISSKTSILFKSWANTINNKKVRRQAEEALLDENLAAVDGLTISNDSPTYSTMTKQLPTSH